MRKEKHAGKPNFLSAKDVNTIWFVKVLGRNILKRWETENLNLY
jgi:hypothetical protein